MKNTSTSPDKGRAFGIVLLCLIACGLGFLFLISNSNAGGSRYDDPIYEKFSAPKTAAELRAELLEKEQTNPAEFLDASGKHWRNLIDQLVIEGNVESSATLASFKDPVVTIQWFSKTGTVIGEESYLVYEFVKPGGSAHFKFKTSAPKSVADIAIDVTDATALQ
ncbi:hypothetical protein [Hymenobacter guriensis]|uniref:Uncharacterized protein n=1 Tax=Hymenobacter guriensis TaxID=2793065 RepID=A0ABS0L1M9_9BACT|nr:hypothetical protein [Hymenobacter guriensis]MBG8554014.1 hypothetical protein [Hymenobacter guriensis]